MSTEHTMMSLLQHDFCNLIHTWINANKVKTQWDSLSSVNCVIAFKGRFGENAEIKSLTRIDLELTAPAIIKRKVFDRFI